MNDNFTFGNIELNKLLNREKEEKILTDFLINFDKNKKSCSIKRGLYLYGDPGSGKTKFVTNAINKLNYDIVYYDSGDIRNKSIIETITEDNMSDKNVMSMFEKKIKKIVIVMDEIDGMNNGDKGGINSLIKLMRPKKTKKQKLEDNTMNPIICIGNYHIDKKIKELIKVCNTIELKKPTNSEILNLITILMPFITDSKLKLDILKYVQNDLRKLHTLNNIFQKTKNSNNNYDYQHIVNNIFQIKLFNDDTREITKNIINNKYSLNDHNLIMNETDRTTIGLLWHENIIDVLEKEKHKDISIPLYLKFLDNICFADYIDRITFQKQIWLFNELTSLIKTFKNNKILHEEYKKTIKYNPLEVRFTKILTKYSTEFNNIIFIQKLCQELLVDKKDLFTYFLFLKENYKNDENEIINSLDNYEITKLDCNRIYRYLLNLSSSQNNTELLESFIQEHIDDIEE
jgi:hypothetical protein